MMGRSYTVTEAELHSLAAKVAGSMAACLQEGVTFVSGDEVDRFLEGRTEAKVSGEVRHKLTGGPVYECESFDWGWGIRNKHGLVCKVFKPSKFSGQDERFERETAEFRSVVEFIIATLNGPSAPQSPVVPGVEELEAVLIKAVPEKGTWTDEDENVTTAAEAIHAHLLANARESREEAIDGVVEFLNQVVTVEPTDGKDLWIHTVKARAKQGAVGPCHGRKGGVR